jgi:hypothetical protein
MSKPKNNSHSVRRLHETKECTTKETDTRALTIQ